MLVGQFDGGKTVFCCLHGITARTEIPAPNFQRIRIVVDEQHMFRIHLSVDVTTSVMPERSNACDTLDVGMPVDTGHVLHVLAHELRTPTGIAQGYARLLLDDRLTDPA